MTDKQRMVWILVDHITEQANGYTRDELVTLLGEVVFRYASRITKRELEAWIAKLENNFPLSVHKLPEAEDAA